MTKPALPSSVRKLVLAVGVVASGCVLLGLGILGVGVWAVRGFLDRHLVGDPMVVVSVCLGLVLLLGGIGFLTLGVLVVLRCRSEIKARRLAPGQPWLWRRDWATGQIVSASGKRLLLLWGLPFGMVGVSAFLWPLVGETVREGGLRAWGAVVVLAICGAILLGLVVLETARRIKFGRSLLRMLQTPACPGRALIGAVEVPAKVRAVEGFKLKLKCLRRTPGYFDSPSHDEALWQANWTAEHDLLESQSDRTGVPVNVTIPVGLPPTGGGSSRSIHWLLEVRAGVVGPDYVAQFEVPVFRAEPASPSPELLAVLPSGRLQWLWDFFATSI